MAGSPPASPGTVPPRPLSAMVRPAPRSNSRMSTNSKAGGGSRASDEDGRTSVRVGECRAPPLVSVSPLCPSLLHFPRRVLPKEGHLMILTIYFRLSRSRSAAVGTHRSRLRPDPTAIPAIDGNGHVEYEPGYRCATGQEAFRFRQGIRP